MLTDQDVQKLKETLATKEDLAVLRKDFFEVFPTKDEVATKEDFERLRKDFSDLQTAVDAYAKKADTYMQEMLMLSRKVDRLERWVLELANKLNVRLKA